MYKSIKIKEEEYEQIKAIGGGKVGKGIDILLEGYKEGTTAAESNGPVVEQLYVGIADDIHSTRMSDDPYFADFYETDAGWCLSAPVELVEIRPGEWGYREYGKDIVVFRRAS